MVWAAERQDKEIMSVTPLSDNAVQPTASTVSDNQIPNPIPETSPASLGVTPAPIPDKPTAPAPATSAALANGQTPQPPRPAAQAPPTPQQLHTSIFTKILGTFAGGSNRPVMGPNGQPQTDANGNVVMAPASKKALGASILAGALSAMVAGYAAPTSRTETGGGRSVQDFGPSAAAGAAASQKFTQAGSQETAQAKADATQARQFTTTDHNLKMHAAMLGNLKLQGDVMNEGVSQDAPLIDAMKLNPTITDDKGNVISAIKGEHVSETALQKMMADGSAHVTRDSVLRDGVSNVYDENGKQVLNPDGTPRQEYTYTVYDHNAQVALTDELKKGNPALQYVAQGTNVPMAVLGKYNLERTQIKNAQGFVNQWAQQVAEHNGDEKAKPIDVKAAIAKDPYLRKLVPQLGRYAGMEPDQAMAQMDKDGVDPTLIGKFGELLGGVDRNAWSLDRANKVLAQKSEEAEKKAKELADEKRLTPEGQQDLEHKKLENDALRQAAAMVTASQQGIQIPKNFVPNPNAVTLESDALSKELSTKGVQIPPDFTALYAIAHNTADLNTLPNNPRPKSGVMPRDQGLSFIRTFINPQYMEGDFKAHANLQRELESTRQGTAGGSLLAAGTAANHLSLLEEQADKLANMDEPAINSVANALGIAVGKSPAVTFRAIANQVNSEVAKVVAGGQPHEAELQQFEQNLNNAQSPEQVKNVIKSYIGLINGRIGEIDDRSMQYMGRHVKGISPTTTEVFNKHGFTVPGQPKGATGTFQSNGKTYWTDGKQNLGEMHQ
jgi:hypothetical protein